MPKKKKKKPNHTEARLQKVIKILGNIDFVWVAILKTLNASCI